jgi:hypothetical protein
MITLDIWLLVALGLVAFFAGTLLGLRIAHSFRV